MDIPHIPGLSFSPNGSALLDYLKQRSLDYFNSGDPNYSRNCRFIPDAELQNYDPEELPRLYNRLSEARSEGQWFFFCQWKEKYRNSSRKDRTVSNVGYWKITSSDKKVKNDDTGEELGKKKTLTFYRGRITRGGRLSNWGMYEYQLNPSYLGYSIDVMPFVVCCVFKRSRKNDDDEDGSESSIIQEEVSSNHGSPESQGSSYYQSAAPTEPSGGGYDSFIGGAGSSFRGLDSDGNFSYNHYKSTRETSYHQQYDQDDDWHSTYY